MKKISILIFFLSVFWGTFAQQKNGTVFIEHPALDKVNQLWAAFEKGDQTAYASFFADTVVVFFNGKKNVRTKDSNAKNLEWWSTEFEKLKAVTDTPAFADAIEYDKGGLWVQDWMRIQGIHKKSGINLDLQTHNLYRFNDDGKISSIHHYFNNDKFEQISQSGATTENGKVYINHPYIANVRKLVNAYCAKDAEAMKSFYSPKATFSNTTMSLWESNDLETQIKEWKDRFAATEKVTMSEIGYPDCIYYAKNDDYVVYSWWLYKAVTTDGKKIEMPMMLSHTFDDDGKIVNSLGYWSSNHYE